MQFECGRGGVILGRKGSCTHRVELDRRALVGRVEVDGLVPAVVLVKNPTHLRA